MKRKNGTTEGQEKEKHTHTHTHTHSVHVNKGTRILHSLIHASSNALSATNSEKHKESTHMLCLWLADIYN